jgi:enoyl-CoA hydratase
VIDEEAAQVPAQTAVTVERVGPVAVLTLARPEKRNAMDGEVTDDLLAAVRALGADDAVHALVITGAGDAFSAGGDLDTLHAMRADRQVRAAILGAHNELFWEMIRLPIPTVAAVNGPAVGAGVTVALLCDIVVMAEHAYLRDPRVSLGLLDGAGGLVLWPLLTSLSAAKEYLLLGDRVMAVEAQRLGLANRVVPAAGVLDESLRFGRRLAALPAQAVRETRRLLNFHVERAATMLDECSRAESACFDTDEHGLLLEQLSSRIVATARPAPR